MRMSFSCPHSKLHRLPVLHGGVILGCICKTSRRCEIWGVLLIVWVLGIFGLLAIIVFAPNSEKQSDLLE